MLKKIKIGRFASAFAVAAFVLSLGITTAPEAEAVDFKG